MTVSWRALGLVAISSVLLGCGGSSSETPYPLEPKPETKETSEAAGTEEEEPSAGEGEDSEASGGPDAT